MEKQLSDNVEGQNVYLGAMRIALKMIKRKTVKSFAFSMLTPFRLRVVPL